MRHGSCCQTVGLVSGGWLFADAQLIMTVGAKRLMSSVCLSTVLHLKRSA